jgi:ribosome-binding protein aMBF1 (putative translation factor)
MQVSELFDSSNHYCIGYFKRYTDGMQTVISEQRAKLNISENLQRLMKAGSITQMQLAAKAAISQPFVHKMLHAKILPNAAALRNVADALGVSTDSLLDDPPESGRKSA